MGQPTERDWKAQEENEKFRPKFSTYVDTILVVPPAARNFIDAMAQNLSAHTLECIRQIMMYGKIDIGALPNCAIEGWKEDLQKISDDAHNGMDSPEATLDRIDKLIQGKS